MLFICAANWIYRFKPTLEEIIAHQPLANAIQKGGGKETGYAGSGAMRAGRICRIEKDGRYKLSKEQSWNCWLTRLGRSYYDGKKGVLF